MFTLNLKVKKNKKQKQTKTKPNNNGRKNSLTNSLVSHRKELQRLRLTSHPPAITTTTNRLARLCVNPLYRCALPLSLPLSRSLRLYILTLSIRAPSSRALVALRRLICRAAIDSRSIVDYKSVISACIVLRLLRPSLNNYHYRRRAKNLDWLS